MVLRAATVHENSNFELNVYYIRISGGLMEKIKQLERALADDATGGSDGEADLD